MKACTSLIAGYHTHTLLAHHITSLPRSNTMKKG